MLTCCKQLLLPINSIIYEHEKIPSESFKPNEYS